jgi:hypothetical protein
MSYFMEIIAIQPPIDIGVDANNRSIFSTNYRTAASMVTGVIELELIKYLQSLNVCTLRVGLTGDTLYGSKAIIPSGDGPWILIKLTGGYGPDFTHSDEVQSNITFQVSLWAKSQDVASAKSWQIYQLLNGKRDIEVNF